MPENFPKWASPEISAQLPNIREKGETADVDFKEVFPEQAHRLGKEIAAMASSGGGRIFIGINDNGDLCGVSVNTGDERDDLAERAHGIVRAVKPVPIVRLHFAFESQKTVFIIEIPKQQHPVFYYDSRPYVRDERRSRPAEPYEVQELVWAHPSSQHQREMERLQLQQIEGIIDSGRELDRAMNESRRMHIRKVSP